MVPQSELNTRLAALQQALVVEGLDAALVVQHADLFYFCGAVNRAILYVPTAGTPLLFALPGSERIREETLFPRIENLSRQENLPVLLQEHGYPLPSVLGLESDVLPVAVHSRLAGLFPGARLADVSGSIRRIRMVKSAWEIEQISQACQMGQQIFDFVPQVLYQQISELELTGQIERFARQLGHPGYLRARGFNQELTYALVLSGPEAAIPSFSSGPLGGRGLVPAFPHASTQRLIGKNEPVIVDFSAWAGGYQADMTRTYCIGSLPSHMEHAYETAVAIQQLMKQEAKAGAICSELWAAARQLVRTNGLCEHFMGMARRVPFIGHGVGVEIDELPVLAPRVEQVLQANMVIAVEPKFVFPDGAVGLENTFVVGEEGLISLVEENEALYYIHEH